MAFQLSHILWQSKWCELFPTIVSKARTIEVLGSGTVGGISGSLALVMVLLKLLRLIR